MSAHNRQVVYDDMLPMEMAAAALDLERLRRGFAELFDRAAHAVQLAGYEQDDALFERYLVLRTADGAEVSTEAEWLADRERLTRRIAESLDPGRCHEATAGEKITNYELRITNAETQKSTYDVDLSGVLIIEIRVEAVVK